MKRIVLLVALALAAACAKTQFFGDPHYPGGATSCRSNCEKDGLEFGGMVYMGEYSSACVCSPPGNVYSPTAAQVSAATGGAAGVAMQTDDDEEEERRRQQTP